MTDNIKLKQQPTKCGLSRRDFLKTSAIAGGTGAFLGGLGWAGRVSAQEGSDEVSYILSQPENSIYSVCLNCHTSCPIKVKLVDGVAVNVAGSPYSPMNMWPHIPEETPPELAALVDAKLCPKGQASPQVLYDPYRIVRVLKRVGARGGGQWEAIDFNQAVDEIVNGGDLFGDGDVEGLADIYKLRDADIAKALADDVKALQAGDITIDQFKNTHADHLDLLIDPDHPDFGPVNNQFVFIGGRMEHGRKELGKRFTYNGFGSTNFYLHTTICEQSHHIAYAMMSGKTHMKPDFINSEFVIFFGTGAFEANFGPTPMAELVTDALSNGHLDIAVVDPRFSKTAAKARWWVPIKPGADAALALGMIRWIIDNERYDAGYLSAPNKSAANDIGETNSTDATHLVRTDTMVFLKPEDIELEVPEDTSSFVVMTEDGLALSAEAESGLLFYEGDLNGIPVKTAFQLLSERANEYSFEEYAEIAGIDAETIVELAREFTDHGKKAAAELYRGPVQHTNGYYTAQAIITLNVLIGNADWVGGIGAGGSHWHEDGSKTPENAPFAKSVVKTAPGGLSNFGLHINLEKETYEKSTLFEGYPAQRPWYPFTNELYQNIIPNMFSGYPYSAKAVYIHKGTPVFASPAGHVQAAMLMDTERIPLVIASDIVLGETSMYADYVFPDVTYMERWGIPHITPAMQTAASKIRQPTVAPLTEIVDVDGEEMPLGMEAFFIAVANRLDLPGFGEDGLGAGFPLTRPEHYYLAMAANLAFGDKDDGSQTLPAADDEEFRIFHEARRHLPPSVFTEDVWANAVPSELWASVVYMLNRGGRYAPASAAYNGDKLGHLWKGQWHLYIEKVAKGIDSMTGEHYDGLPLYEPIKDVMGNEVNDSDYPLLLSTYKEITGGQSRTAASPWLHRGVLPENYILMNSIDAENYTLQDGDLARLVSASSPDGSFEIGDGRTYRVEGRVRVIEGIRPGVVSVSWSYGHWAYGSNTVTIDNVEIEGDASRGSGVCANPINRLDPVLGDVCLTDPIGGSASFYDTRVDIIKI
jgi:tetrathionate reductase subunit A